MVGEKVQDQAVIEVLGDQRMADIDARQWDALAGDTSPFLKHAFLLALEESGAVTTETGWQPCHVVLRDGSRRGGSSEESSEESGGESGGEHRAAGKDLLAALPLYLKSHSWGEYVFDWGWADAYRRYGHSYYPKLVSAVPFTPSPSPRLLVSSDVAVDRRDALYSQVYQAVTDQARERGASSWHVLFPHDTESAHWQRLGMIRREATQFHWFNQGYRDFDDFLASFSSRKRKNMRREREEVSRGGFGFVCLEGPMISDRDWDIFFRFYENTYHVRGQEAYLNREFFARIGATMADDLFLIMAEKDGSYVAGALFFKSSDTLYGRYWGSQADYSNLHFETCYYQGIEYCLRHGLQRFDAGAQGEHKLRRGFEPVVTLSAHWIADPAFRHAIGNFCVEEAEHMALYREHASSSLPFRRDVQD